jgi:hypothetical protein
MNLPLMTLIDTSRTERRGNRRGTREIFEAWSADGVWHYHRGEETGTSWHLTHLPTGRQLDYVASTLTSARKATASGWAIAELDRRDVRRGVSA